MVAVRGFIFLHLLYQALPRSLFQSLVTVPLTNIYSYVLKGTVSPDIVFYFKVYQFKSVLLVRPLMVLKLVYFVVL
jgi:hypothetical protein